MYTYISLIEDVFPALFRSDESVREEMLLSNKYLSYSIDNIYKIIKYDLMSLLGRGVNRKGFDFNLDFFEVGVQTPPLPQTYIIA